MLRVLRECQKGVHMDRSNAAFDYAIRIAELVRYLRENPDRFPLSAELLAAGVRAGMAAQDIESLQGEAARLRSGETRNAIDETLYLIDMAVHSGYLTELESTHVRTMGTDLRASFEDPPEG